MDKAGAKCTRKKQDSYKSSRILSNLHFQFSSHQPQVAGEIPVHVISEAASLQNCVSLQCAASLAAMNHTWTSKRVFSFCRGLLTTSLWLFYLWSEYKSSLALILGFPLYRPLYHYTFLRRMMWELCSCFAEDHNRSVVADEAVEWCVTPRCWVSISRENLNTLHGSWCWEPCWFAPSSSGWGPRRGATQDGYVHLHCDSLAHCWSCIQQKLILAIMFYVWVLQMWFTCMYIALHCSRLQHNACPQSQYNTQCCMLWKVSVW